MEREADIERDGRRIEALYALVYYVVYVGYLGIHQESEFWHWVTLVILPFWLISLLQRRRSGQWSLKAGLGTVGLRRGNLARGLIWVLPSGLAISLGLQLIFSSNSQEFIDIMTSPRVLYLAPLTFLLLTVTAGFTEEFFFRGIIQTRLSELLGSRVLAVLAVSVLFALYHLPYAYLNPAWPSHGDFGAAVGAAMFNGAFGGVVIGFVYALANGNLMAAVIAHSLIDLLPAMALFQSR
ncbi:MAG: CPBP family intramembrane glutamic endopeptidase [Acidimicrobiia bacterium]